MHTILIYIQTISPLDYNRMLTLLLSGTGVAVTLQIIKHFNKLQDAKKLVMFLLGALSFVATFADWFIQYSNLNPKLVVGANLGWVVTFAVFVHRFAVSPIYYKINGYLNGIYSDAKSYRAEVAAPQAVTPVAPADMPAAVTPHQFTLQ